MKVKPVVIIIPILIAFLGLIIGSSLVWQLFIFSVIILVLGYLWLIINVRGIEVKVKDLPGHSRVGDWFEEEFIVSNNSVIPKSGLIVSGVSDLPGYGNSVFLDLSPEDSHSWKSRIDWLRSETSSTIGQVREYTSGDTLNHIHWPSTAHVGTLMVKVFENDQMRYQSRSEEHTSELQSRL